MTSGQTHRTHITVFWNMNGYAMCSKSHYRRYRNLQTGFLQRFSDSFDFQRVAQYRSKAPGEKGNAAHSAPSPVATPTPVTPVAEPVRANGANGIHSKSPHKSNSKGKKSANKRNGENQE